MELISCSKKKKLYKDEGNYFYISNRIRDNAHYLKCAERGCPVRAVIHADVKGVTYTSQHNHQINEIYFATIRFRVALRRRCINATTSCKQIYEEEALKHPIAAKYIEHSGQKRALFRFMRRARMEQKDLRLRMRPKLSASVKNIVKKKGIVENQDNIKETRNKFSFVDGDKKTDVVEKKKENTNIILEEDLSNDVGLAVEDEPESTPETTVEDTAHENEREKNHTKGITDIKNALAKIERHLSDISHSADILNEVSAQTLVNHNRMLSVRQTNTAESTETMKKIEQHVQNISSTAKTIAIAVVNGTFALERLATYSSALRTE